MKILKRPAGLILLLLAAISFQSQDGVAGSNLLFYGLAALALIIFFYIVVSVADNFMVIESRQMGIKDSSMMGLFPSFREIFRPKKPEYLEKAHVYTLTKGYDIPMEGEASPVIREPQVTRFAVSPPDFFGLMPIPKVLVEEGDTVKAGDPIFYDKKLSRIKFVAPVSGEVIGVNRGLKRSISEIVILADKEQQSRSYTLPAADAPREELVEFLLESGVWPVIRQRPYNRVADPDVVPRDIFISTFDSAPLAPDLTLSVRGRMDVFQAGIDVVRRLTDGLVYLGLDGRRETESPFTAVSGAEKRYFRGAHPAGNVGVQIHHIHPCGAGDNTVWTLGVDEVLLIGELFQNGRYDTSRLVALTGSSFSEPCYVKTYAGANIGELIAGEQVEDNARIISGDVLSGIQKSTDGFMTFFENQVTAIPEGNEAEMFGWLVPVKPRASISPTIPVLSDRIEITTNTHGEKRAFVVNNDYEQVMPMDIYLTQLMKSILVNDLESMEGLGIYELVPEDVALAEFACVSKQPLQQILRQGHDTMIEQG
ncbi:Na+-transporting NADH:ubiquinone oxidoreductase subunit A [Lewinella marina]|uniref:Na(+)-translocating NADH-quinone reductase subunit A n=1 Tax=Neolewinella marina TaxID=438751 RepID=A0A2G0CCV0_9BACT|nr:Na(+)-translocating NADH-quinone reductase subunit A [Neolewinella marina]NJB87026.1 Na+-transporting NADH:ubiquinone oxidoreductase subunit A [Neolewinella marina]PHK97782.1 NADH:ubiquinone reductase (Na(+)-transporting) subunit A [Neolewinella marina]